MRTIPRLPAVPEPFTAAERDWAMSELNDGDPGHWPGPAPDVVPDHLDLSCRLERLSFGLACERRKNDSDLVLEAAEYLAKG